MALSAFIRDNRKALFLIVVLACLIGAYYSTHLPVAIFPDLTVPRIIVTADAGDAPIPAMLSNVTRPLENAVAGVPGVRTIHSLTQRGGDELDITFEWGTDMQATLQKVQANINQIQGTLPPGTSVQSERLNPSVFPIMGYSLYSKTISQQQLRHIALYTLRPRLLRVTGVQQIDVLGGDKPDYLVQADPGKILARGVTLQNIQDALSKTNAISSVGSYDRSYLRYDVLVSGLLHGPSDIEAVTVAVKNRVPVTIGEIATVRKSVERRTIATSGDGHDAVLINVVKQPAGNTVQVAQGIAAVFKELRPTLPPGITVSLFYDQSQIVLESQASVIEAIALGGALALVVLMLFLGNLRAAAVVLLILPLTILITFGLMKALGQTMNIMTLGALAIALGLVIDDGIVVVENIFYEMEQGKSRYDAIAAGLHTITPAMIGSSLTTIAAFLPLTFLSGVTGEFFGPLAIVMIATLLVSLSLALLLVPLLAEFLLPRTAARTGGAIGRVVNFFPDLFVYVAEGYAVVLRWCLRHPALVLLILVPVMAGTYFVYGKLETGFFPEFDEGGFVLDYQTPAGTSLTETDKECRKIETILAHTPEVASWSRRTGAQLGFDITTQNSGDFSVRLKSQRTRDINAVIDDVRTQIAGDPDAKPPTPAPIPAVDVDFGQILQDNIGDIAGSPKAVEVKIFGDDINELQTLAGQVDDVVHDTPGIVDDNNGIVNSDPEVQVDVDGTRAQRFGLSTDEVTAAAGAAVHGVEPTAIQEGEEPVGVRVQVGTGNAVSDPAQLGGIPVGSPVTGGTVPLSAVAGIHVQAGTPQITRENQRQMVAVTAGLQGRDLGSAVHDVQARIAKAVTLPPGYSIEYGGLYASQQESFAQLATVLLLAVLFVFTMLLIISRSYAQSIAVFVAALMSMSGVLTGLWVTKTPLNISSFTGAILILGIVTENGIILFDFFNTLRKEHPETPLLQVMVDAGKIRLRPKLMTTLGAILALFPLALGLGAGAAMQKPLAIAVIGGLCVTTIFTLIVAPVLFVTLESVHFPRKKPSTPTPPPAPKPPVSPEPKASEPSPSPVAAGS